MSDREADRNSSKTKLHKTEIIEISDHLAIEVLVRRTMSDTIDRFKIEGRPTSWTSGRVRMSRISDESFHFLD